MRSIADALCPTHLIAHSVWVILRVALLCPRCAGVLVMRRQPGAASVALPRAIRTEICAGCALARFEGNAPKQGGMQNVERATTASCLRPTLFDTIRHAYCRFVQAVLADLEDLCSSVGLKANASGCMGACGSGYVANHARHIAT
jgi:hypothetical protein